MNRHITALALGINCGLVYALLGSTLTVYLDDNRISLALIGLLSLRMFPYSLKPLWSPLIDNFHIKLFRKDFGQRKAWLVTSQCILILCIMALGAINVQKYINVFFCIAALIAFVSATSDIALDGYRIELFEGSDISKGSFFTVLGFRAGLFVSGAFGLYLAALYPWQVVFFLMGIFLIPGLIIIILSKDNRIAIDDYPKLKFRSWIKHNLTQAIHTLFKLDKIIFVLLLLGFYKVSDAYLDTMLMPFLTQVGFSKTDIAQAKTIGIITGVIGNFVGVKTISKLGMRWNLLGAEILAAITNLLFLLLICFNPNNLLLYVINGIESFCGGICNIALMSYMSSMCINKKFTASHFAILTSVSIIFRTLLSGTSGWVVVQTSWIQFFIISALLSLPSILCIYLLFFKNKKSLL